MNRLKQVIVFTTLLTASLTASLYANGQRPATFARTRLVYDGYNPHAKLAIAAGGNTIVAALGGPVVWVSRDSGLTWSAPNAAVNPAYNVCVGTAAAPAPLAIAWPSIAVSDDGARIYFSQDCVQLSAMQAMLWTSNDAGETWTTRPPIASGTEIAVLSVDRQNRDRVFGVWHDYGTFARLSVARSLNGGQSADQHLVNAPLDNSVSDAQGPNQFSSVLVDPTNPNRLFVMWAAVSTSDFMTTAGALDNYEHETKVAYSTSSDGGATWTAAQILDVGSFPNGATWDASPDIGNKWPVATIDAAGNIYLAFAEKIPNTTNVHLMVMKSTDHGATWSPRQRVDSAPYNQAFGPAIVAGARGKIGIAWLASEATNPHDATAAWSMHYAYSTNADSDSPTFTDTLVESDVYTGALDAGGNGLPWRLVGLAADKKGRAFVLYFSNADPAHPADLIVGRETNGPLLGSILPGVQPHAVASRKRHAEGIEKDIALPLTGTPGVECRSGGGGGNFEVVFAFGAPISFSAATVSDGVGSVASVDRTNPSEIHVFLQNVADAQTITLTLQDVSDGSLTNDVSVDMSVLLGDTTGDGVVNSADIAQTKSQSGEAVSSSNFRADVTVDGTLNSADIALVKSKSGTALP